MRPWSALLLSSVACSAVEPAPATSPDEVLSARVALCAFDAIPTPRRGQLTVVEIEDDSTPGGDEESWVIHAARAPGADSWRAGLVRAAAPLAWQADGTRQKLVIQQGRLTGRALTLIVDRKAIEISVQSFTDSGPPFLFDWSELRAEVTRSERGRLFVRVRGVYDFEGQGRSEGAICAVVPAPS